VIGIIIILYYNDYISLFLGFELQTIPLYILAAKKIQKNYSIEAGLKYFILSSFASSLILFGFSFLYGLTGTTNLIDLNLFLSSLQLFMEFPFFEENLSGVKNFIIFPFLLIFSGLFLKIGLFPFHIWIPDVYEGVPTIITLFFSTIPKIPLLFILIKFLVITVNYYYYFQILILICSLFSIFVGGLGAIFQTRIKRILAFSAIHSTGFFILPLFFVIENPIFSILFSLFYIICYIVLNFGIFAFLLTFRRLDNFLKLKNLLDLKNLFLINLDLIFIVCLLFFISTSIPPFLSFFSKFFIIKIFLFYNYFYLIILILFISAMSSFYYLRIIKLFFFKIKEKNFLKYSFLPFSLIHIFCIFSSFFIHLSGYLWLIGDYIFNDLHNLQNIVYFFQIILTYWIQTLTLIS
jgi:NADH-quinone oxidoreductase subunit N